MAGPIYKLWMTKYKDAWYQLSEEERNGHLAKVGEALKKVDGKTIKTCMSAWSTEQWQVFGMEEFPDVEAVREHTALLQELNHFRYFESVSMLGTKWELS